MSDRPVHHARGAARRLVLAVGVALVCVGTVGGVDASASADRLSCGQTITKSTKLRQDLVNCPANGLVIGADDITLDLNGHTIDGDGVLGCEELYACDFGVDNAGHRGVTIKGGSIREFATAVVMVGGSQNRLRRLSSSHNVLGGLLLIESPGTRIEQNSISANGLTTDQAGLIVFDSSAVEIEGNSVRDNGDIGMFLVGLSDSRVERNSISGNPEAGIILDGSGNEVSRNRLSQNGDGIAVGGDGNSIALNLIVDAFTCEDGGCGGGIAVEAGADNLVTGNGIARAAREGIRVNSFDPEAPVNGTVIRGNVVRKAGVDGFAIATEPSAPGVVSNTLLERNIAIGSGDDGIDVDSTDTSLRRNTADGNGDLGIEAVAGVTDLGGNRANGNGNPLECLNVFCR
jgi:parallel beta-helix repeat protein